MPVENLQIYRSQLDREIDGEVEEVVTGDKREAAFTLYEYLVKGTPVDTGETRKRWHISVGTPSNVDKIGGDVAAELLRLLGNTKTALDPLYIQNNSIVAVVLEYGLFDPPDPGPSKDPRKGRKGRILVSGGFSTQAPRGIVGDAIAATARRLGTAQV